MGLADQTEFSMIWSTHIVIDVDLFQGTCILFAPNSLENHHVDICCTTIYSSTRSDIFGASIL